MHNSELKKLKKKKRKKVRILLFAVKVHAADGGRVAIKRMYAGTRLSVPHLERAVGAAADNDAARHLG